MNSRTFPLSATVRFLGTAAIAATLICNFQLSGQNKAPSGEQDHPLPSTPVASKKVPACPVGSQQQPTWKDNEGETHYACGVEKQNNMGMCLEWEDDHWNSDGVVVPCGSRVSSTTDKEYTRVVKMLSDQKVQPCPPDTQRVLIVRSGGQIQRTCNPLQKRTAAIVSKPAPQPSDPASKEIRIGYGLQLQTMLRNAVKKSGNDPTLNQVFVLANGEMLDDNERKLWEPANLEISASLNLPDDVVLLLHNSAFNSRLYRIGYRGLQLISGRTTCNIHLTARGAHPEWCDWATSQAGVVTGKRTIHEWPPEFYVTDGQ